MHTCFFQCLSSLLRGLRKTLPLFWNPLSLFPGPWSFFWLTLDFLLWQYQCERAGGGNNLKGAINLSVVLCIPDLGLREAANFLEKKVQSTDGCLCSSQEGVPYDHSLPLFLLVAGLNAVLDMTGWLINENTCTDSSSSISSCPSSTTPRASYLFCKGSWASKKGLVL